MQDENEQTPMDLGIYQRFEKPSKVTVTEVIAISLSAVWLVAVGAFFLFVDRTEEPLDNLRFLMTMLAIFLPVAMIWVAAMAARSSRIMREESSRLQAAIDAMRQSYVQNAQVAGGMKPSVERKLNEIAIAQRKTESAIATFTTTRTPIVDAPAIVPAVTEDRTDGEDQGKLALGTSAEELATPINMPDFIRAMHFPENAEDKEGFKALRRALEDRRIAQLIQASQDVLTMLSHDGIYMDDLRPERARPEIWRRFAKGERGRTIAGLGGVRDRSSLALASGRMRQDAVFRDAVHHFLRLFDKTFTNFEDAATDQDIVALTDTRTARAFMLLGRVTGTFT